MAQCDTKLAALPLQRCNISNFVLFPHIKPIFSTFLHTISDGVTAGVEY